MLFNSLTFLIFFVVVLGLHRLVPGWSAKKGVLLLGSYVFYTAWNPPYVAILLFSTVLDWWLARRIWLSRHEGRRKALVAASIVVNLAILGFFKYGDFLLTNLLSVLQWAHVVYVPPQWNIILPVGISFYTFASLSYTIDVYRRELPGDAPLLDYALFVSFFPHLVAGPIVRARTLLPQFKEPRHATSDQVGWGLVLVVVGLFCKGVLADALFAPVVDSVYAAPENMGVVQSLAAMFGFSGQIYYDFAGYSLCAIGLALCFGFSFPDNFRFPYAARGFSDFWRRWHISLSTWLRDYLYIPLGGNRGGAWRIRRNLMLTMLLGGLWHGASWMFVLWGGLHGLFLVAERAIRRRRPHWYDGERPAIGLTLVTFLLVTLAWLPFRAASPEMLLSVIEGLGRWRPVGSIGPFSLFMVFVGMLATLRWQFFMRDRSLEEVLGAARVGTQAALMGMCLVSIFLVSGGDERAFIYFQF
jgi:alginate O-acetyltransferase complex protein AlgI